MNTQTTQANKKAKELATLKATFSNTLPVQMLDKLPDGSRVVVMVVPTASKAKSSEGNYKMVVVKLGKSTKNKQNPTKPVKMAMTSTDDSTSMFGSYFTSNHATDEEALWEAVRRVRYNR